MPGEGQLAWWAVWSHAGGEGGQGRGWSSTVLGYKGCLSLGCPFLLSRASTTTSTSFAIPGKGANHFHDRILL